MLYENVAFHLEFGRGCLHLRINTFEYFSPCVSLYLLPMCVISYNLRLKKHMCKSIENNQAKQSSV